MSTTRTIALLMVVTVAACAKKEASRAADTLKVDTTGAAPAAVTPPPAETTAAATTLSDPNIVFVLHAATVTTNTSATVRVVDIATPSDEGEQKKRRYSLIFCK